jgi:hypothetical protein
MRPAECRSCKAPVYWAVTTAGNRMPVDVDQVPGGNIELEPMLFGTELRSQTVAHIVKPEPEVLRYRSHFVSCPDRREWKRH